MCKEQQKKYIVILTLIYFHINHYSILPLMQALHCAGITESMKKSLFRITQSEQIFFLSRYDGMDLPLQRICETGESCRMCQDVCLNFRNKNVI